MGGGGLRRTIKLLKGALVSPGASSMRSGMRGGGGERGGQEQKQNKVG